MENKREIALHTGIRPLRKYLRVTQKELAARVPCSASHLCMVEQGKNVGSVNFYEKICHALGVPFFVLAMESVSLTDLIRTKQKDFFAAKKEMYRMFGVFEVAKQKMNDEDSRKLVERLWKKRQSSIDLAVQEINSPTTNEKLDSI